LWPVGLTLELARPLQTRFVRIENPCSGTRHLEFELLDRVYYITQAEGRIAIFEFTEGRYELRRRHSAIGYL